MDILKSLLFDQEKIVTSLTLSRHADISVDEASKHLEVLYAEYKGSRGLNAVFTLVGFLPGDSQEPTHMLVKESNLEDIKHRFQSIQGQAIFSLQTREIEDLYDITAGDDVEDEKFFRTDSGRANIQSTQVSAFRLEKEEKYGTENIIPVLQPTSAKPSTSSSTSIKGEKKKEEIKDLFKKSAVKDYLPSTPKGSPTKPTRDSPFSSSEKKKASQGKTEEDDFDSPVKPKRRTKKIMLDDEEDSPPAKKENIDTRVPAHVKEEKIDKEEPTSPARKKKFILDDGDLYDANGSPDISPMKASPKKEEVEPMKKKAKKLNAENKTPIEKPAPKQVELRRSPRKKPQSDLPPGKKRVVRRVTETYQDEDGFLVTKEVMREEIIDIPEEELQAKPLTATLKLNKEESQKSDKIAAPAKKAQSKISSFFSKK